MVLKDLVHSCKICSKIEKMSECYDLKWKKFYNLRLDESFTDVTLVSDDYSMIKAHKLVLIASSQYFHNLLKLMPLSSPFICLEGVSSSELNFLVEYTGCPKTSGHFKISINYI